MSEPLRTVNVGLIGLGTVGGGVARLIKSHHDEYLAAYGIDLKLTRACALAWEQAEAAGIEREAFTSDWHDVVTDPAVDIVVELIGGEHPATEIFTTAFEHGKHVVSANKALLGRHVETLAEKARACGVQIKCEASCGGGIPIVSTLEHDLVGNKILTIAGILNGTTNYILTRMSKEGAEYADVLADAQRLGLAEPDPASDVEGLDAAYKLSILASLAFHGRVPFENVYVEGITQVQAEDIRCGQELGYTLKLLAIAKRNGLKVETRVHPTFIRNDHPLANISGAFNAVFLHGHACGEMMFMGRGAGDLPTASAIVSDLVRAASAQKHLYPTFDNELHPAVSLQNNTDWRCAFYTRMLAKDEPGVLSRIAQTFADHGVSIAAMQQKGEQHDGRVTVVFITHQASERDMQKAILEIRPEVATVDEKGTVTAVAPGTTVITASMENGQKAECTVNCTWSADAPSQEPAGTEPAANGADAPAETKPTLSANDITLDSEGDTQQITVTGASGEVTWTSSDTKIATVTADGTITAVAPGRATVTAKVGDQTLNCAVRCIW